MTLQHVKTLIRQGESERARALLEFSLREHPTAEALFLAATLCDDCARAMDFARRALTLDPNYGAATDLLRHLRQRQPGIQPLAT